jgi:hypothetical protein
MSHQVPPAVSLRSKTRISKHCSAARADAAAAPGNPGQLSAMSFTSGLTLPEAPAPITATVLIEFLFIADVIKIYDAGRLLRKLACSEVRNVSVCRVTGRMGRIIVEFWKYRVCVGRQMSQ